VFSQFTPSRPVKRPLLFFFQESIRPPTKACSPSAPFSRNRVISPPPHLTQLFLRISLHNSVFVPLRPFHSIPGLVSRPPFVGGGRFWIGQLNKTPPIPPPPQVAIRPLSFFAGFCVFFSRSLHCSKLGPNSFLVISAFCEGRHRGARVFGASQPLFLLGS